MEKEAINWKESTDWHTGWFGDRKGKGEMMPLHYNLKIYKTFKNDQASSQFKTIMYMLLNEICYSNMR